MTTLIVSITPSEKPFESVRRAVDLCEGFAKLPRGGKVFIKPNIIFWTRAVAFPKWGMITTSRVVEDIVVLLKDHGIDDITIGEGTVIMNPTNINEAIAIKSCPPIIIDIVDALKQSGIDVDPSLFENYDRLPGMFMHRYEGKSNFDEALFKVN